MISNNKYQCPLCKKTMIDVDWSKYKSIIASIPIPANQEIKDVELLCNDCLNKTNTTFHPIAIECLNCGSFNTVIFKN
jgi:Zn finger protein HypA/HybF involved in hydrogenase expression